MAEEPDPPRKFYGFKPREFAAANPPRPAAAPPPAAPLPDPGLVRPHDAPIDVRELHPAAATGHPLLAAAPAPARENDVHAILRHNLAVADAAGLNRVALTPKRPSRRRRDYWLALALGNAAFAIGGVIQPVFAAAGFILYNVGLTWIMWGVLDDY